MRSLIKLKSLYSNSSYELHHLKFSRLKIFLLSSSSRSSRISQYKKIQETQLKNQSETNCFGSLFNEITEILGSHSFTTNEISSGFSISKEPHLVNTEVKDEFLSSTQDVCRNAEVSVIQEGESMAVSEDTQMVNLAEEDVSPVVHEIAMILRAENGEISIEERLEKSQLLIDSEIVDKVLKRCFKVPHLALRFFNWVKLKDGFCHTTKIYNTMLYIAGEAKEFGLVEQLVKEMEKNSCEKDIKTWTILISQYGKAKLIGMALLVFEKMRKCGCEPDVCAYKVMIRYLCAAEKADIAMEFYKEMVHKEMVLDKNLYKMLLNCIVRSGDSATVHSVADDTIRLSQLSERDVYGCILKSYCISGKIREALVLIHGLKNKDVTLEPEYFKTLVRGLCRADRITDALEIVDIMKRRHFADAKVFGIIINGYLRRNDVSKALNLFESMKESGHLPTSSTYTELMQHLFGLNEYEKGCKLYDEMLERGIELDSVAITAMVAGHVRQKRIFEAWKVFRSMEDKGIKPTWKSYSIFIKELCKISRSDEIFKVLNEMQASRIVIRDEIFHWIISYMEKKGETENIENIKQMQRLAKLIPQEGVVSGSNTSDGSRSQELQMSMNCNQSQPRRMDYQLVEPLPTDHNEQDMQKIYRILSSSVNWCLIQEALQKCSVQFTPELVVEVLRSCSMHGNPALHFFSWVGKQAGYSHTTETYNMAIKISGQGKDFKHMRELFFEMRRNRCLITPDTWTIMIMQYGRTGLTEIALTIFREMKDNNCNPTGSTYKYLIVSLCVRKGRKVDEAIKLFQEMIRAGYVPDKELVETYLGCLCEVGQQLDARRCIDSLCKVGFTVPLAYSMYIRALCRAGRLEEALAMVDEVGAEKSTVDQYVYGSLVHGLLQRGRLEEALAKVDSMKQTGISPTVHVYTSLIVYFSREKQIGKALEIFEKMQQEGCEPSIVTYSALIRGYMNTAKVADAWNVFHHIKQKGPSPDFKTYSMFINCLCKVGKSEEALQLLSEMLSSGIVPSTVNFRTVFHGLNREGKQNLALTVTQQKLALINKRKFLT